ncbi:MAG: hypothetical protein KDD70_04875 [Bdellovibrionales bacterium]|nr:hypothetical protein [Bdellovibrionales bacterium]
MNTSPTSHPATLSTHYQALAERQQNFQAEVQAALQLFATNNGLTPRMFLKRSPLKKERVVGAYFQRWTMLEFLRSFTTLVVPELLEPANVMMIGVVGVRKQ